MRLPNFFSGPLSKDKANAGCWLEAPNFRFPHTPVLFRRIPVVPLPRLSLGEPGSPARLPGGRGRLPSATRCVSFAPSAASRGILQAGVCAEIATPAGVQAFEQPARNEARPLPTRNIEAGSGPRTSAPEFDYIKFLYILVSLEDQAAGGHRCSQAQEVRSVIIHSGRRPS